MNEMNLTDVLEEYALAATDDYDAKTLERMIEKYPQFADELRDFAAASAVLRHAPAAEMSAEEAARRSESGMKSLRAVLGESEEAQAGALQSLTEAAKAKGLSRAKFAEAVGISVSLVQYLEKRRLDFKTVPRKLVERIAAAIEMGEEAVARYLSQPPVSMTNASFKAAERPIEMQPKSFAEAVREDQQLSDEEKRKLLELT